jgi:transcriptional regulator with XRE-family HTH domain
VLDLRNRIRDGSKRLGLSQAELAERVGTNEAHVSQWETGKRRPSRANLERLNALLVSGAPDAPARASWPVHLQSDLLPFIHPDVPDVGPLLSGGP